ncbi:hypothetical protein EST38_g2257 [Candolleomyces aberdarensis]|uniref:Response regulatory domain-containing protein n=1 Tax=Candolleomyces aberdarensis TaxID=2316362 RepID=A0A4Q2DTD8_9AGAR|nr:hypothetical protein EST38_g2257 [Candolleomyces aberdarensis]
MPLPSQLNELQHPHRTNTRRRSDFDTSGPEDSTATMTTVDEESSSSESPSSGYDSPHVKELSYELADSIQMVVQTLLQISPAQVLDPTKEQFTACSLSVPTSSMSAMFTVMKNINFLSANMESYFTQVPGGMSSRRLEKQPMRSPSAYPTDRIEFDIGDTLQAIGDSLSGSAAQVGVDLVLYHGDVSLKHVNVYGDEASLRYAITQVIQQVLNTAERGDSVELGLLLTPIPTDGIPQHDPENSKPSNEGEDPVSSHQPIDVPLKCTICISHKFASPERAEGDPYGPEPEQIRPSPILSTISIRHFLRTTSSTLRNDLPPPSTFPTGRTIELDFPLRRARSSLVAPLSRGSGDDLNSDTTLPHLISFAETLKGKKVTLYSSPKGSFAQHLTSYLTAWGMLVSHVSPEGTVEGVIDTPNGTAESEVSVGPNAALLALAGKLDTSKAPNTAPDFIFIDDDIEILKERLQALRIGSTSTSLFLSGKRPPLALHHRPRSTTQIPHAASALSSQARPPPPVVILHFTSLSNYKHLKDTVQGIVATYAGTNIPVPEVMIIPKPAGPRRFLAALFTAVTKPPVDPQFSPIATSPMSPRVSVPSGGFFGTPTPPSNSTPESAPKPQGVSEPVSPIKPTRPTGSRSNSERSSRSSTRDGLDFPNPNLIPPSPLSIPDNLEYFEAAAQKLGTTPSSGFVIQSPDGQPAGILFRPNLKPRTGRSGSRLPPTPLMERDKGQRTPSIPRRTSNARDPPTGMLDFGALHTASLTNGPTTTPQTSPSIAGIPSASAVLPPTPPISAILPSPAAVVTSPVPTQSPPTPTPERPGVGVVSASTSAVPSSKGTGSPTASAITIPTLGQTRKSSMGPKQLSPPGSPQADGATPKRSSTRKASQPDKETTPTPASSIKKSKATDPGVIPPISVLIVDDNPINQTILSTFMRKKKIKYDIANNGLEAVQKWRTGGFHLILMDIQMPIMDGIEATKEIRRIEKTSAAAGFPQLTPTTEGQRTPSDVSSSSDSRSAASPYRSSVIIVALTASSLQSDRVAALAAGCNDFLTKPVSLLWLNNKIIEWGSIKALQMWADLRPDAVKSMNNGQAVKAKAVAENLRVPPRKTTPSPKRTSSLREEHDAAIALASQSGDVPQAVQKAIATAEAAGSLVRSNSKLSRAPKKSSPPPTNASSRRPSASPDTKPSSRERVAACPPAGAVASPPRTSERDSGGGATQTQTPLTEEPAPMVGSEAPTPEMSGSSIKGETEGRTSSQDTVVPGQIPPIESRPQPPGHIVADNQQ